MPAHPKIPRKHLPARARALERAPARMFGQGTNAHASMCLRTRAPGQKSIAGDAWVTCERASLAN
eukprot:9185471-Alexandrium_andersonii.AAC.1